MPTKKTTNRKPFTVYFKNSKMVYNSWVKYNLRNNIPMVEIDGLSTFESTLTFVNVLGCASGSGAQLTDGVLIYDVLPIAFSKMVDKLNAGSITGKFGFVNRSGRNGIELIQE